MCVRESTVDEELYLLEKQLQKVLQAILRHEQQGQVDYPWLQDFIEGILKVVHALKKHQDLDNPDIIAEKLYTCLIPTPKY